MSLDGDKSKSTGVDDSQLKIPGDVPETLPEVDPEMEAKIAEELGDMPVNTDVGKVHAQSRFLDIKLVRIMLAILAGAVFVLAGIGVYLYFDKSEDTTSGQPTAAQIIDEKVTEIIAANPDMTVREVNNSVTDDELGYTVTVGRVLVGVPMNKTYDSMAKDYAGVAVEVEINNHSNLSDGALEVRRLLLQASGKNNMVKNDMFSEFVESTGANLAGEAKRGMSSKGLLFFVVPIGSEENLMFIYDRPETVVGIIGQGSEVEEKVIPEQTFAINL